MLVTEHKHPVMPTKNHLREIFIGDACAIRAPAWLKEYRIIHVDRERHERGLRMPVQRCNSTAYSGNGEDCS